MNRKNYLFSYKTVIILFCTVSLVFAGCKKDRGNDFFNSDKYEFFTNPNDPCFLKAVNNDGSEIIFSGDKDKDGNLLSITNVKIINGNSEYNVDYANGKVIKFRDNNNNTIFIEYKNTNTAIASFIGQNSDTIYHFQIACKNRNTIKSFTNSNGEYYLRYKIKLEYVDVAPYSKFSTNYYNHKVIIYDDYVRYEKNAELVRIENNQAVYQLKLNQGYENEPLQNDIAAGLIWVIDALDIGTITLGELASEIVSAAGSYYGGNDAMFFAIGDKIEKAVNSLTDCEIDPYKMAKAIRTDRKIGDDLTIMVYANGTGVNWQTQTATIKYIDLKQQQNKDIHLQITLKNIFPFEEVFMYSTDPEERTLSVTLTSTMGGEGGSFPCILKPDGVCLVGNETGRWSQSGNNLGIEWTLNNEFNCRYRLTGTVGGNLYRGTYTHHDHGSTLYDEGKFNGKFQ